MKTRPTVAVAYGPVDCYHIAQGQVPHMMLVAWWVAAPSMTLVYLCQSCLDWWCDNADNDPGLEPAEWGWLV